MKPLWWPVIRDSRRWSRAQSEKAVDADVKAKPVEGRWRKKSHTPSNLVVARWTADVESTAPLDFLLRHDLWTPFGCLTSCNRRSIISVVCDFTTKSFMKTCVFTPTHETGILMADIIPYTGSHDTRLGRESSWPLAPSGPHIFSGR
jgi:hypothetical protein